MELPKIHRSGSEMLGGIKSKLGFADKPAKDDYAYDGYDDYAEDGDFADDYGDDYGEYGYDPGAYSDDYADYAAATPASRSAYDRSSSTRSGYSSRDVSPRLVSIDDVRANTQIPDRLNRDPLPPRHVTSAVGSASSTIRRDRVLIDNTMPSPGSPESMRAERSAGLESLFEPTTGSRTSAGSSSAGSFSAGVSDAPSGVASIQTPTSQVMDGSYDPFEAYAGSTVSAHAPRRGATVIKPVSYGDVERVAKIVRAGDIAVLSLKNTPDDLAKRVLDFSFGVACYADARVDCIADKVFAIVRGDALTDAEFLNLRSQGVV